MPRRSSTSVETDVVLRALAISWVVFNHSQWERPLAGGMTFLFLLSGLSFARFAIDGRDALETRRSIASLCRRIWLPSFLVLVLEQLELRQLEPRDLLFVGIWFDHARIQRLDVWYLQVLLQILVLVYALFLVRPFSSAFRSRPFVASLALFGVALAVRAICPLVWDTSGKHHQLPHLYLWNFTLGWVAYFAIETENRTAKLMAWACAAAAAFVAWRGSDAFQFWSLSLGMPVLLFVERVRLPVLGARAVTLVSQATFAIYLLHRDIMYVYTKLPWRWHATAARWLVAMLGSIGAWVLFTATVRAMRKLRSGRRQHENPSTSMRQAA